MGQYFIIANLDKKQYLDPQDFGQGVKLQEFTPSGGSVMMVLGEMLADGGMGEFGWQGDRISICGDEFNDREMYDRALKTFVNVSPAVRERYAEALRFADERKAERAGREGKLQKELDQAKKALATLGADLLDRVVKAAAPAPEKGE